jgi:uncharacterized protein YkwD
MDDNFLPKSLQRALIAAILMIAVAMIIIGMMAIVFTLQTRPQLLESQLVETVEFPAQYSLDIANAYRRRLRLPDLALSTQLTQVAQGYAAYYAQQGQIHMLEDARIRRDLNNNRYYIGGDLRQAYGSVEGVWMSILLQSVMESDIVRQHLEDSTMRDLGFGWAEADDGSYFYAILMTYPETMSAPNVGASGGTSQEAQQGEILRLLNQARAAAGLTPLRINSILTAAAYGHSVDMASNQFMAHDGSDGSTPPMRALRQGFTGGFVGENVLVRSSLNASGAFNQWWNSPPHYDAMMNPDFREIGIAYAVSSEGNYYYTMLLGG